MHFYNTVPASVTMGTATFCKVSEMEPPSEVVPQPQTTALPVNTSSASGTVTLWTKLKCNNYSYTSPTLRT